MWSMSITSEDKHTQIGASVRLTEEDPHQCSPEGPWNRPMLQWRLDPHFLDHGTSWRWVVSFKPLSLYPRGNNPPGTHWIGDEVDPRAGLEDIENWKFFSPHQDSNSDPLIVQTVDSRYTDYAISTPPYAFMT
jgi:hypothetical protein